MATSGFTFDVFISYPPSPRNVAPASASAMADKTADEKVSNQNP